MLKTTISKAVTNLHYRYVIMTNYFQKKDFFYKISFYTVLTVIFSIILFLNIKTHLTGDDYVYSFLYLTSNRLTSISEIFESQYTHYLVWGGRSVVHFIAQLLLLISNPLIADIINSLAFIAYIYVVYIHITAGKGLSVSLLLIIFSLTWLLQPAFAETILWITGSANYLWGTLFILLFLLPFRLYVNKYIKPFRAYLQAGAMFTAGIIAGWTNENTAAAMIIMIILFILYYRKIKKYTVPLWMYTALLGSIVGYCIMIMAPGNFVRAEGTSISPFLIFYRTCISTQKFINYLGVLNLGLICLLVLLKNFCSEKKHSLYYLIILSVGLFVSIFIMTASPGFPPRSWFGPVTFNIIMFGIVFYHLSSDIKFLRRIKIYCVSFLIIIFGFGFYDAYRDVTEIDKIRKERLVIIEQKQKENACCVSFKEYQPKTKFGLGDTPYALKYISQYYNIDIQLEK